MKHQLGLRENQAVNRTEAVLGLVTASRHSSVDSALEDSDESGLCLLGIC